LFGDYTEKLIFVCISLSPFVSFQSLFVTYLLTFSRIYTYILGESNGKLLLRTCPGCSVPEP
jgi:hypothetical protein